MSRPADLITFLFDGRRSTFSAELLRWMEESTRFTAFIDTYRDKVRKKIRVAEGPESALDVRAELEVACRLLSDRRFNVIYEPVAAEKRRGPDFGVTYRVNTVFYVEVARIRADSDPARKAERILRILLDKLGQMQPSTPNLLAIRAGDTVVDALDLAGLMQEMKTLVESKHPAFYAITRYASPADFYRDFLRLSGIVLWSASASQWWANKQARPVLEEKTLRVVAGLFDVQPPEPT